MPADGVLSVTLQPMQIRTFELSVSDKAKQQQQ
jgi:hypothetical protein